MDITCDVNIAISNIININHSHSGNVFFSTEIQCGNQRWAEWLSVITKLKHVNDMIIGLENCAYSRKSNVVIRKVTIKVIVLKFTICFIYLIDCHCNGWHIRATAALFLSYCVLNKVYYVPIQILGQGRGPAVFRMVQHL